MPRLVIILLQVPPCLPIGELSIADIPLILKSEIHFDQFADTFCRRFGVSTAS